MLAGVCYREAIDAHHAASEAADGSLCPTHARVASLKQHIG